MNLNEFSYSTLVGFEHVFESLHPFSRIIIAYRNSQGLSLHEAAVRLQVSAYDLYRMERGDIWGTLRKIPMRKLESLLHIPPGELKKNLLAPMGKAGENHAEPDSSAND